MQLLRRYQVGSKLGWRWNMPLRGKGKTHEPQRQNAFYKAKVSTARFFMERLLPEATAHFQAIMAGGKTMMAFEDASF